MFLMFIANALLYKQLWPCSLSLDPVFPPIKLSVIGISILVLPPYGYITPHQKGAISAIYGLQTRKLDV